MATDDRKLEGNGDDMRPRSVPPRYGAGPITTALHLGPLGLLPGSWKGTGFTVMWRPDNPDSQPPGPGGGPLAEAGQTRRFLQLNLTNETLDFHVIPGAVPNRGLGTPSPLNPSVFQQDLELYGLHYLQRVSDNDPPPYENAGEALHIEPGLFMNVPASLNCDHDTIVRMGSIPHGVNVLMQGPKPERRPERGRPHIPPIYPIALLPTFDPAPPPNAAVGVGLGIQPVNIIPPPPPPPPPVAFQSSQHTVPEVVIDNDNDQTVTEQSNSPLPPFVPGGVGFPTSFQDYITDPNQVLRDALVGQEILGHVKIKLSTQEVENPLAQIPFLGIPTQAAKELNADPADPPTLLPNAFVTSAEATFWIEWVKVPGYHHSHYDDRHGGDNGECDCDDFDPYRDERTYLQLQYSQTVILLFNNVLWPHIAVATLRLSSG